MPKERSIEVRIRDDGRIVAVDEVTGISGSGTNMPVALCTLSQKMEMELEPESPNRSRSLSRN